MQRWREARKLPLNLHPRYFPVAHDKAAGLVIAAEQNGGNPLRLTHALLRAVWAEERNIDDVETLRAVAQECGEDADTLITRSSDPEIARLYESYSAEALVAGVFGVPAYVIEGEIFWGQDRLDFVEARLKAPPADQVR